MNFDLSLFIGGQNKTTENLQVQEKRTLFSYASVYFLWTLLGVGAALFIFSSSSHTQVKHMVVFKYKPDASPEQIRQASSAFLALRYKIPGIVSFEHGDNISLENKAHGFNHVYLLTFENAAARDAYMPHPELTRFNELLAQLAVVEDEFVVDF